MSIWDMLASTWPAQMGQTIAEALMAPGNAYRSTPDNPVTTEQMVKPAADLAGLVMAGATGAPAMSNAAGMGIRAYHGSPYDFNKFDLSKIGTGEGAQAYGHGLYFAENPNVAQVYHDSLGGSALEVGGKKITPTRGSPEDIALAHLEDAFSAQSSAPFAYASRTLRSARELAADQRQPQFDQAMKLLGDWQAAGG